MTKHMWFGVTMAAVSVVLLAACPGPDEEVTGEEFHQCRLQSECNQGLVCCREGEYEREIGTGTCVGPDLCVEGACQTDEECDVFDTDDTLLVDGRCCENECVPVGSPKCGGDGGAGGGGGNGGAGGDTGGGGSGGAPPITPGDYPTLDGPEAPSVLDFITFQIVIAAQANLFEEDHYIAIAGSAGQRLHRLSDGGVAYDFTTGNDPSYAVIGANNSLVSIGPQGYADRRYNESMGQFGFAQLGLIGTNITGLTPVFASASVHALLLANNASNRVHRLDPVSDSFGGFVSGGLLIDEVQFAQEGLSGHGVVHTYSPPGEGPIIGIGDSPSPGQPGRLWWYDPALSSSLTSVGDVGEGPRRVDCLEPAGTPCAVSNYTSGQITLVDWPNRAVPPTIGGTTVAVDGPVGIDVAMVDGSPTVVATGFNDDSIHLITIGANLTPTDQSSVLSGCTQPGHAVFVPGATHVVVTCNGSDNFQVLELPLSL